MCILFSALNIDKRPQITRLLWRLCWPLNLDPEKLFSGLFQDCLGSFLWGVWESLWSKRTYFAFILNSKIWYLALTSSEIVLLIFLNFFSQSTYSAFGFRGDKNKYSSNSNHLNDFTFFLIIFLYKIFIEVRSSYLTKLEMLSIIK